MSREDGLYRLLGRRPSGTETAATSLPNPPPQGRGSK